MLYRFDLFTRTDMAAYMASLFNAGTTPAEVDFYTGVPPASPLTAITTQTLLGTLVCSNPACAASGAQVIFDVIGADPTADASGTATWARIRFKENTRALDVDVTSAGGNGVIKLNTVTIVAGGPIAITSFVITMGGA